MEKHASGDLIEALPIDNSVISDEELQTLNTIFKKEKNTIQKIFDELKGAVIVAVLFVIASLPMVDDTIKKFFPSAENWMILTFTKAIVIALLFYFINNIYTIKTK